MGKKKRKFKKKINPGKSNKMIYAVAFGLAIVFLLLFLIVTKTPEVSNKLDVMKTNLEYLKKTDGIKDIKFLPEENRICLYYKHYSEKEKKRHPDFKRVALFAGLKLSNKLPGEKIQFELIDEKSQNIDLVLHFKSGKVIRNLR